MMIWLNLGFGGYFEDIGGTTSSLMIRNITGNLPALRTLAKSVASSMVKPPSREVFPLGISAFTTGQE